MERTFVMIKPDGVRRGLVGRIISRLEDVGLKLVGLKILRADKELVREHYPDDPGWLKAVGEKTLMTYKEYGMDPLKQIGTDDPVQIGRWVREKLVEFITSGPVVAMVWEGNHAIEVVRKLVGNTVPLFAGPGTIRGDFSADSPDLANREGRPVYNLVHASGDPEEAEREVRLWFRDEELLEGGRDGGGG